MTQCASASLSINPMSLIDKFTLESRSHGGCSNSHYHLCRTTCCGHFGLDDIKFSTLPIPEPSTWALRSFGLGGLFWTLRRRKAVA